MKSYPPEIDELMARVLAGESSEEDRLRFDLLLSQDEMLRADFETLKLLLFSRDEEVAGDEDLKKKFKKISRRLGEEGLM